MTTMVVKRGDIFYADLSPVIGSEQGGIRPVIIIQNDIGNRYSPTVIVAAITSQINKAKLPTHVEISSEEYGLNRDSVVLLEQVRTLDEKKIKRKNRTYDRGRYEKSKQGPTNKFKFNLKISYANDYICVAFIVL